MKTFISNAKINLGLKVLNKRPDNYHNIHSYFMEINLSDELIFSPNENHTISIIGNCPNQFPLNENNLITKYYQDGSFLVKAELRKCKRLKFNFDKKNAILSKKVPCAFREETILCKKQMQEKPEIIKNCLIEHFDIPYSEGTLHEFVASGVKQKKKGIKVLDIAKALLDYGFHAPTIYFPSIISEAMMIEPTESETKETLDRFIATMLEIDKLINKNPELIMNAPINTPVKRLDETKANRELDLRWEK